MKLRYKTLIGIGLCVLLTAGEGGCDDKTVPNAVAVEQNKTNDAQLQLIRNQPVPVFDYSREREMMTEIYKARQHAISTFSVVQSEYTGKVLWSCPSIGFPIPYATQLTNPQQAEWNYTGGGSGIASAVVALPEPNGLYSPAQSDATWVPCVNKSGKITPVYEEKHVTVFFQPMHEVGGTLVPVDGTEPSFSISGQK